MAFALVKEMQADGLEWGEGYRPLGRRALSGIIEGRMSEAVDGWLDDLDGSAMRDRRNGFYRRHLLSELGDIELCVPRTRRFCPTGVPRSYARRAPEILDRHSHRSGTRPETGERRVGRAERMHRHDRPRRPAPPSLVDGRGRPVERPTPDTPTSGPPKPGRPRPAPFRRLRRGGAL